MAGGPVSNRRFSRRKIRSLLMIGGGVLLALVVGIGGWQFYSKASQSAAEADLQEQQQFAEAQAETIAGSFSGQHSRLEKIATEAKTLALFTKANVNELTQRQAPPCRSLNLA